MSTNVGAIHYDLNLDTSKFDRATDKVGSKLSSLGSTMATFAKRTAVVGVAMGSLAAVIGVKTNAELETATLQFKTLMGSAEGATKQVKMLFDFAKKTPFETQPIINASLKLQAFGGAALNTEANLKLIGDAAAAVGADIEEVGFWVGRAYAMIQSGKPFGEAAMRLQELAILSPQARAEMEKLQESGASSSVVFAALQKELSKYNGAMLEQATTFKGLFSTLSDIMKLDLGYIFEPLFQSTKKAAVALIQFSETPAWQKIKDQARGAVEIVTASFDRIIAAAQKGGIKGAMEQAGKEFSAFVEAANNSISDGLLANILTRIINGFLRVLGSINWSQYANLFTNIFTSILAATDFVALTAKLTPILVKAALDIITGFIQGIITWAVTDPLNFIITLVSIFFMPGKWAGALAGALGKIPLVGMLLEWLVRAINWLGGAVRGHISGFVSGFVNYIKTVFYWWFGNASSWLWGAGSAILHGLWEGMKSKWGAVANWVGSLGSKIKNLKGPLDKDKIMLINEGNAIMQGLNKGMQTGYEAVERTLSNITSNIPRTVGADINVNSNPNSGMNTTTISMGDIHIADKQTADYFFNQLNRNGELARKGLATI